LRIDDVWVPTDPQKTPGKPHLKFPLKPAPAGAGDAFLLNIGDFILLNSGDKILRN